MENLNKHPELKKRLDELAHKQLLLFPKWPELLKEIDAALSREYASGYKECIDVNLKPHGTIN